MRDIPARTLIRIKQAMLALANEPRPRGSLKLKQDIGFRISAGDYRIIYDINDRDRLVVVEGVLHRKDAYR
jgi:mRNA interferase RelE/StbE